ENRELLEALGGPAGSLERLGLVLAPGYTLSKLLWSRRRFPELFARFATDAAGEPVGEVVVGQEEMR
ncbi:hypothetical protein ACV34Z_34340, partial [Pseudomonas aeruginosa]